MTIKKFVGDDCELSTNGKDPRGNQMDSWDAAGAILEYSGAAFAGYGWSDWTVRRSQQNSWYNSSSYNNSWYGGSGGGFNRYDSNRHWLPGGGCQYCDLGKVEVCSGETLASSDYAARHLANLKIAEAARRAAEAAKPGARYQLSAANVDPRDPATSWGTHFNVQIDRCLWEDLHHDLRRPNVLAFVVSALAASTVMFGSGYLLPLAGGEVIYSLSARAPHLSKLNSLSTTVAFARGILNSRRQGFSEEERQHLINFDYSPLSARLRCVVVQALFAAAEEGYCGLNLLDPVKALRTWSFGLDMQSGRLAETATLADGRRLTLPQYMRELCTVLLEMVSSGLIGEDVVPEAGELLPLVIELTHQLEAGALARCARHLDWAIVLLFVLNSCTGNDVSWGDPATRLACFDYSNTDPERGWFWKLWEAGEIDPLVTPEEVDRAIVEPPAESRAWARAAMVRRFGDQITAIDWDHVELRRENATSRWANRVRIELPELESLNRAEFEPIVSQARDVDHLVELLDHRTPVAQTEPVMEITGQLALPEPASTGSPSTEDTRAEATDSEASENTQ